MSEFQVSVPPVSLIESELWLEDSNMAQRFWSDGYRPVPAHAVQRAMLVMSWADFAGIVLDPESPRPTYIRAVRVVEEGVTVRWHHTHGVDDLDWETEVWAMEAQQR